MMTPKFLGKTPAAMRFKRFFASADRIFCERKTSDENGTRTTLRPASEISAVSRGPLVEMASLAICTMICPDLQIIADFTARLDGLSNFMDSMRKPAYRERTTK